MCEISIYHFANRQDSATVQGTVQKSKIRERSEFETVTGKSDVGSLHQIGTLFGF